MNDMNNIKIACVETRPKITTTLARYIRCEKCEFKVNNKCIELDKLYDLIEDTNCPKSNKSPSC